MAQEIFVNDVIEWKEESSHQLLERVLWIDENYTLAFVFDIHASKGFPKIRKVSEIKSAIANHHAAKIECDPWARIVREEDLTQKDKEIRDEAWKIIFPLVVQEPSIYYRHLRGALIQNVIAQYHEKKKGRKPERKKSL